MSSPGTNAKSMLVVEEDRTVGRVLEIAMKHAGFSVFQVTRGADAVDRLERVTTLKVRRISHKWAGLRTFAPDKSLIAGFDPDSNNFFWLAGQGGYGIQTSPSMGRIAAALIAGQEVPPDLAALGLDKDVLGVERLRRMP